MRIYTGVVATSCLKSLLLVIYLEGLDAAAAAATLRGAINYLSLGKNSNWLLTNHAAHGAGSSSCGAIIILSAKNNNDGNNNGHPAEQPHHQHAHQPAHRL